MASGNAMASRLVGGILGMSAGLCLVGGALPTGAQDAGPTLMTVIAADSEPTYTGVVVSVGQLVEFDTAGSWCLGGTPPTAECGGPEGIRSPRDDEFPLILDSAALGELIGRVADGPWFPIGATGAFTMPDSGDLWVMFNDRPCCYGDNSGEISLSITPMAAAAEQAPSPLASLPTIPLPAPSLDPLAPEFPRPEGAELVAAQADSDDVDAYRTATWRSPDDVATTSAFYEALSSGRWTPAGEAVITTIATTLELADAEGVFDRAALTITADPPGALVSVRFLPPGGPAPVAIEDPDEVIAYGTLPPSSPEPVDLPAWALPEGAELVAATTVAGVVYAELLVPADPAAVLDAYGRALDAAGLERAVSSTDEAIVILLPATDPPGSVALARDPAGTRAYLTLP